MADSMNHDGGCTCGAVRYRLQGEPMFVHCCHCHYCQRGTGSAFVLNALIEADRVEVLQGEIEVIATPSPSGKGQRISRCPHCHVALWSTFGGAGESVRFVRVGTLDEPARCPPDIHIYTSTKHPWIELTDGKPVMEEFYKYREHWPQDSLQRLLAAMGK